MYTGTDGVPKPLGIGGVNLPSLIRSRETFGDYPVTLGAIDGREEGSFEYLPEAEGHLGLINIINQLIRARSGGRDHQESLFHGLFSVLNRDRICLGIQLCAPQTYMLLIII